MALFSADAPALLEHSSLACAFTPFDVKWLPCTPSLVISGSYARGTGALVCATLAPGGLDKKAEFERPAALKCSTFGASDAEAQHLAVGDYAGRLQILDFEAAGGLGVKFDVKAHKKPTNAIDGCGGLGIGGGAPELVTGGQDGAVHVWDPRVAAPVVSLEPAETTTAPPDCWTVAFGNSYNDTERCIVAGYDNGDLKLFDLRTSRMRWETNVGNGVVCAEFDRKDIAANKLVVTTLESKFRVYDMQTQHPVEGYAYLEEKAHKATVWLARHLPQNRDLWMTTGGNGGMNIYKYRYPVKRSVRDAEGAVRGVAGTLELLNARIVSSQPIVSYDWHRAKLGLGAAASLDQTVRVFMVTNLDKY